MYRQIRVHKDDWDLQRIFWATSNQATDSYRLTTVTYELNCAPFLALQILQLLTDKGPRYPLAIPSLRKGRYVDDIFGGALTIQETKEIIEQLVQLCNAGGFLLQKWSSNHPDLLSCLTKTTCAVSSLVEIDPTGIKIVGLYWQPTTDTFQFTSCPPTNRAITKRTVLSEVAQLFDFLGLISPVIIRAKIFIQELWLSKLWWDESLSPNMQYRWNAFRNRLPALSKINIPRWLHTSPQMLSVELHGFSDASHLAMAAAVYIRTVDSSGLVTVNLICAKTRVVPLKRLTIPRLELTAALILARLISHVRKAIEMDETPITLWTDSKVTLAWLSTHPSRWKDYVHNRVTLIQEIISSASWRFISGNQNPADCASRGIAVNQLHQHSLWWTSPSWLAKPHSEWPSDPSVSTSKINLEERPSQILSTNQNSKLPHWDLLTKYSTLNRLLRVTATCQRAIALFRHDSTELASSPLTPAELQRSSQFWVKQVQSLWFSQETKMITEGSPLSKSNPLTRFTPYIDNHGLLRVGGRLQNARLSQDSKHPIILSKESLFTTLVIFEAHLKTLHGGADNPGLHMPELLDSW